MSHVTPTPLLPFQLPSPSLALHWRHGVTRSGHLRFAFNALGVPFDGFFVAIWIRTRLVVLLTAHTSLLSLLSVCLPPSSQQDLISALFVQILQHSVQLWSNLTRGWSFVCPFVAPPAKNAATHRLPGLAGKQGSGQHVCTAGWGSCAGDARHCVI